MGNILKLQVATFQSASLFTKCCENVNLLFESSHFSGFFFEGVYMYIITCVMSKDDLVYNYE